MIRVVLADDEEHVLNQLKQQIPWKEQHLLLAGTASDGEELMKEILQKNPKIVITDIVMPVMTGLDVAAKVRKLHPEIHFILTSAYADFAYARTALQLGLTDLLPKPVIRSELCTALRRVCLELGAETAEPITGESQTVRIVRDYIKMHYEEKLSLESVADQVFLSPAYLSRLFKQETGQNFKEYLLEVRIGAAKRMLCEECFNISQIAEMTGLGNSKYFSRVFREKTGQTPSEYREGQAGRMKNK